MRMTLALMVFTIVPLAACGPVRKADLIRPDDPRPLIAILESGPALTPLRADALFTPVATSATFDAIDGDNKRSPVIMKRFPTSRFGATWAEAENDVRTEFYRVTDEGDVLLTAAIDYQERAVSLFDPPLTAVYATLKPGRPHVQEVGLRIVDLRNRTREREAGTATQTIEHLGRRTIRTEGGTFTVDCISVRFDASLRLARAKRESTLYVLEGVGVIAAEHVETITALGLFSRTSRQTLLRRDVDVAASDKSSAATPAERSASAPVEADGGTRR